MLMGVVLLSLIFILSVLVFQGGVVSYSLGSAYLFFGDMSLHFSSGISSSMLLMLLCCSMLSLCYAFHYLDEYSYGKILAVSMFMFSTVMVVLVLSYEVVSTLMLEYLGLVSFLLMLYYGVWSCYRGGVVTLVSSRFGDVALFFLLAFYMTGSGSSCLVSLCMLLVVATKSALFPFSSWLLEAMRAPTPVSSLVHSSTLVAAGMWFYLEYSQVMKCFEGCSLLYSFSMACALLTMLISGTYSLICNDMKQSMALSTCSNISWVVVMMLLGEYDLGLVQLVIHGLSKCLVFILVGDYISGGFGGQKVNQVMVSFLGCLREFVYLFTLLFGLSGFPFICMYFSKHAFISSIGGYKVFKVCLVIVMMLCVLLSVVYSLRLFFLFDGGGVSKVISIRRFYSISLYLPLLSSVLGYSYLFSLVVGYTDLFCYQSMLLSVVYMVGLMVGFGFVVGYWKMSGCDKFGGMNSLVVLFKGLMYTFSDLISFVVFRW
uniref:NADH:ubiquinone reductase (H(+)-translocating) n=1 Tax=Schistosoma mansoni TaxID=6183 RepID=A0A3Q0KVE2_SCHMA